MTRTELIVQLLKIAIGLAFGAYFVWWSSEVLDRLTPDNRQLRKGEMFRGGGYAFAIGQLGAISFDEFLKLPEFSDRPGSHIEQAR